MQSKDGDAKCAGTQKNYKCIFSDKKCIEKEKKKGNNGPFKKNLPCKESCKSGGAAGGKCQLVGGKGKCVDTTDCKGKKPVNPKDTKKNAEQQAQKGGGEGMPKLPEPPKGGEKKPPEPKKEDLKNQNPCLDPNLNAQQKAQQGCPPSGQQQNAESSVWKKLLDYI